VHGAQADARLFSEFTLTDVRAFVDQVHDPKVDVGVLGLILRVHMPSFGHAAALPSAKQYQKNSN